MKKNHTLTNRDISEQYRNTEFYLMKSELLGTLASWLVQQSPYDVPNITKALKGYNKFLEVKFDTEDKVVKFTYEELSKYIYDFVDLGALSRNVFYEICRKHITQPL